MYVPESGCDELGDGRSAKTTARSATSSRPTRDGDGMYQAIDAKLQGGGIRIPCLVHVN